MLLTVCAVRPVSATSSTRLIPPGVSADAVEHHGLVEVTQSAEVGAAPHFGLLPIRATRWRVEVVDRRQERTVRLMRE